MRASAASILVCVSLAASAQNWALLNPAYKYNCSLGGTDTITNQIFVTHIDTLGPDSFRYDLNRVGVWCDTCPGSQGGAWWLNQPQFLGLSAIVTPTIWVLEWPDHQLTIKSGAVLLESWLYDPDASVMATVTSVDMGLVLGEPDSIKTVSLSDGGTITLSREHGMIGMPMIDGVVQAIGIQDLGLGSLIPEAEAFFALMPGDVVQYHTEDHASNNAYSVSSEFETKYTITDRYVDTDTLVLEFTALRAGDSHSWYSGSAPVDVAVNTTFADEWRIPSAPYGALRLIGSYPGEVIYFAPGVYWYPNTLFCIAEHGIDEHGRYVVRAKVGNTYVVFGSPGALAGPDMFGGTYYTYASGQAAEYRTGPGLQRLRYYQSSSGFETNHWSFTELTGSVIAGDTIGHVDADSSFLGVPAIVPVMAFGVFPSPADETLNVIDGFTEGAWTVMAADGRIVLQGTRNGAVPLRISTAALKEGLYFLCLGQRWDRGCSRFVVAH